MRTFRPDSAHDGRPNRHRMVAITLSGLMISMAAANPPQKRIATDVRSAAAHPGPQTATARVSTRDDATWHGGPFDQPVIRGTRTYPARFSEIPDLHSRSYLQTLSIPTLGGDGHGIRDQSPTEQFIRQARKEGLPLARLWQNDQALLSLGLNRKGKPGLWIIQKTP